MRYHFAASILAALGISVGTLLLAPAQAQHYTATLSSAATSYQLGAGDVISVQVTNFPELSAPQLTVPPDGKISVQFIEGLSVTGKTTSQVAALLAKRWTEGQYVANPSVTVTLTQQRKQIVQIYGHVAHAQTIDYKNDLHLVEALAQAGGFADDGDPAQVTVTRKNGTSQTVDLTDPETKGGSPPMMLSMFPSAIRRSPCSEKSSSRAAMTIKNR